MKEKFKTGSICKKTSSAEKVFHIPLKILHEDPKQMRKTYNPEYIGLLADTIDSIGLLHPIAVLEEKSKKKYRIIAGHCRSRAFRTLKKKTIPARIFQKLDKETLLSIQISENTYQPVPLYEAAEKYYELYSKLKEKYGKFPLNKLSKVIGRSESSLRDAFRFVKLNPKVKRYIKDGVLPYSAGVYLAELDDQKIQNELAVHAVVIHANVLAKDIKKLIAGYEDSKKQRSLDEIFHASQKEAEAERIRQMKFFVDKVAHSHMLNAIGYWKNLLYLHKLNEGTAYDPLGNKTIRDRFKELDFLVQAIHKKLKKR